MPDEFVTLRDVTMTTLTRQLRGNRHLIFGVVSVVVAVSALTASTIRIRASTASDLARVSTPRTAHSGTEVLGVLIVKSTCAASSSPALREAVARIRTRLSLQAAKAGKRFYLIGVALDEQPTVGIDFLKPFGEFDEIVAGGDWFGTGSIDFIVRDLPGPRATPQLVLIEREIHVGLDKKAGPDLVLTRRVGVEDILSLASANALPGARLVNSVVPKPARVDRGQTALRVRE